MKKQMMSMFVLFLLCLLSACGTNDKEPLSVYRTMEDLKGKRVAVMTGCFQEAIVEKDYPEVKVIRVDSPTDMVQVLLAKQCEALVMEDYNLYYYLPSVKGLSILPDKMITTEMGVCFEKGKNIELREQFNAFLAKIKADGTYDEIYDRWINHANEAEIPVITFEEKAEPIRVGTSSTAPPLDFITDGELAGLDIELMTRFAASIGRRIIWSDMNFSALIPALVGGTQDMVIAGMNITPQRAQSIDFSDPYFICNTHVVVRAENSADYQGGDEVSSDKGFWEGIKNSFYRNIIEENRYLMIVDAFKLTALISLFSALLGTLLGGIVCWMRMCRNALIRRIAIFYIGLMRGMPILVLLMLMFYVVFAGTSVDAVVVSIITFAMNFAAYVSEMFRASIEGVDRGQTEAGIALGFTPVKTFFYIVMPQAFKQVLPIYKGELISLVKMTSIVGYIAVQDLTKVGDIIRSRTFDAFFPLLMVAILYFLLSWIFALVLDFIGRKTR